jgi:hypothetical protein
MNKEEILKVVADVKSRREDEFEMFDKVINYINTADDFSYDGVFKLLDTLTSGKLGGRAMYTNKAIRFLGLELKAERKRLNSKS